MQNNKFLQKQSKLRLITVNYEASVIIKKKKNKRLLTTLFYTEDITGKTKHHGARWCSIIKTLVCKRFMSWKFKQRLYI